MESTSTPPPETNNDKSFRTRAVEASVFLAKNYKVSILTGVTTSVFAPDNATPLVLTGTSVALETVKLLRDRWFPKYTTPQTPTESTTAQLAKQRLQGTRVSHAYEAKSHTDEEDRGVVLKPIDPDTKASLDKDPNPSFFETALASMSEGKSPDDPIRTTLTAVRNVRLQKGLDNPTLGKKLKRKGWR